MQTFESVYKSKFKEQLTKFIDDEIIVSNDINIRPFSTNPDLLISVIKTGIGQASSRNEIDLVNTTINVNFLIQANKVQDLLGALTSLIWNFNGKWDELKIPIYDVNLSKLTEKTYIFKPVFTTPVIIGDLGTVASVKETITIASVVMSISLAYSSNVEAKGDKFWLRIQRDGIYNWLPINAIEYDMTYAPAYDSVPIEGNNFIEQVYLSETIIFRFTLLKKLPGVDLLQDVLTNQFLTNNPISKQDVKLRRYDPPNRQEVDIQKITIEERFVNSQKFIVLTLER